METHIVGAIYEDVVGTRIMCKGPNKDSYYFIDNNNNVTAHSTGGFRTHESMLLIGYIVINSPKEDMFNKLYDRLK